jgi:hypothetical protein
MVDCQAPRWGSGIFDWSAPVVPLAVGVGLALYGLEAANSQTGSRGGDPSAAYFIFGSVALLFAAGDVRMLVRGGVSGSRRIARRLFRMCYALFTATASFFLGRQIFPAFMRKTVLLFLLSFLPLILMIFWLFRVRFKNAYEGQSMPRPGDVYSLPT